MKNTKKENQQEKKQQYAKKCMGCKNDCKQSSCLRIVSCPQFIKADKE